MTSVQEVFGPNASLGVPVKGLSVRVLGRRGQLLPAGCPGELCVGGIGLARGYQNLPKETQERFLFSEGRRLYRTGDLVRWSRSGELLYLGRMDDQVKLRGFRIELGEIESVLSTVDGVTSCCVLLRTDGKVQFLCGYFTATRSITAQELKDALSRKLPYYMVPSAFLQIAEMPVTSSGKTDKRALAALKVSVHVVYRAPQTRQEETVVLLSKGEIDSKKVRVEFSLEDMDMSGFQKGATYEQIKAYVLEHTGLKVSSLYISQIKRKCGLDVGQNYNLSKKEDAKVPKCPPEKEAAIRDALKYFQMI